MTGTSIPISTHHQSVTGASTPISTHLQRVTVHQLQYQHIINVQDVLESVNICFIIQKNEASQTEQYLSNISPAQLNF